MLNNMIVSSKDEEATILKVFITSISYNCIIIPNDDQLNVFVICMF